MMKNPPPIIRSYPRRRVSILMSYWISVCAGMSGLLLSGCLEVSEPTLSIEVRGDIITKIPNPPSGVQLGMSKSQVAKILYKSGFTDDPEVTTITNDKAVKSDCGKGDPILLNIYSRNGEYEGYKVEYVFKAFFNDTIQDAICEPKLKLFNPVEVRQPSYMEEIK